MSQSIAPQFALPFAFATAARIGLAVGGGYALAAGLVAVLVHALHAAGLARADAVVSAACVGFVVYLAIILWAVAEPRLARVALVVLGGALAPLLASG